jgi:cyclase
MERRNFIKTTALTAASFAFFNKNGFAKMLAEPAFQFKPLYRNVGMFAQQGGTIAWLVNKEGIVVVDAEYPDPATHLITLLKQQSDLPFEWLINTHHHGDHTAGNISFKGIVKNVAAHKNSLINQTAVAKKFRIEDQQLYPDTTFSDKWKIKVGDEQIMAHYFGPAHTNGDVMVHFENAGIVHTGDLVFNRNYPYVDRNAGASVKHWIIALEKAQKKFDKDTQFVFGHAYDPEKVIGVMDDLTAMRNFLERTDEYVTNSIKAGKSKDDMVKVTAIPGITDWQGDGVERAIIASYEEQTGK